MVILKRRRNAGMQECRRNGAIIRGDEMYLGTLYREDGLLGQGEIIRGNEILCLWTLYREDGLLGQGEIIMINVTLQCISKKSMRG